MWTGLLLSLKSLWGLVTVMWVVGAGGRACGGGRAGGGCAGGGGRQ